MTQLFTIIPKFLPGTFQITLNSPTPYAGPGPDPKPPGDLLLFFEQINVKDSDSEAKRFLAPLMNTLGILMAQDSM